MNMRGWLLAMTTTAVLIGALPEGAAASANRDVSPVFRVPALTPVAGSRSTLVRHDQGITFSLHTSELALGTPTTFLLVIFNNPAGCTHGVGGLRCGEGDVVPGGSAQVSVVMVTERKSGRDGRLGAGGGIGTGDDDDAVFGPGLTNPIGADIHMVVQQHGAIVQASVHES